MTDRGSLLAALLSLSLAGCTLTSGAGENTSPRPSERPATTPTPASPVQAVQDPESVELARFYKRLESDALVRGLLRQDGGGVDTPINARILTSNFMAIAMFSELGENGRGGAVPLQRWKTPVTISLHFGASATPEQKALATSETSRYATRLAKVTGHPIRAGSGGNFEVYVVSEAERRTLADNLPGVAPNWRETIATLPRRSLCLVMSLGRGAVTERAIAIVRAELPPLLMRSCLHEEIAQGFGLSNDSPRARPSIFNDDEEFALLTTHDELLLSILYDDRLRPGMGPSTVRPIVAAIAEEKFNAGPV